MKIFAFTDVHEHPKAMKIVQQRVREFKPDIVVCCGDLTIFEHSLGRMMKWLSGLHKEVIIIPGNHETVRGLKKYCKGNVKCLHQNSAMYDDLMFVGWGGGGFSLVEPEFERFTKQINSTMQGKRVVLITHAPPYGTKLDFLGKNWGHVGCKSITKFLKTHKVLLALSGHIHETFGKKDRVGGAVVCNPGPLGLVIEV